MAREIRVEIVGDARSLEAALGKAQTASMKFQQGLAPVARGAKIALLGIGALGVASAKLAIDFDRTASQIVGLAGVGTKQVEEWKGALLDLAPVVGKTPDELAKALYFVASSGVKASKALGVVKVSAEAASAGLGDTQTVADAVTSAMNAYAKENLSAAQATDVLVATVREGKGEASAIAPVLGNILPIASQLGVGFNQVGAAMASMTRLGFDAATAATNLSGVFNALLKPQAQAEKGFEAVGTSSAELQKMLAGRGLLQTLQFLKDRFEGNNAAMAKAFPNVRALRGVLSLVGKAGEDTAKVFKKMEDNTGSLGTAFKAVSETDSFKLQQSFAQVQAAGIKMGAALAPVIGDMASGLSAAAGMASRHTEATRALAGTIAALSVAIIGANSALKIYNSTLAIQLGMQPALRTALAVSPWLALAGGIALVVDMGLNRLHDALDTSEEDFKAADAAARSYKAALDGLKTSQDSLVDSKSRLAHAQLNEETTAKQARTAIKEYGKGSLEARQAILDHKDAVTELARAEDDLSKKTQDRVQEGVHAMVATKKFRASIETLRESYQRTTTSINANVDANSKLYAQLVKPSVEEFAAKLHKMAIEAGGAKTASGRAAQAVADLTTQLGRIPTKTEIELVTNADRTRDAIERVRAAVERVPRSNFIDFYLRIHGHAPPNLPQGASGGIVNRPTVALIGERGPEAVVPLNRTQGNGPLSRFGKVTNNYYFPNYLGDKRELEAAMRDIVMKYARQNAGRLAF